MTPSLWTVKDWVALLGVLGTSLSALVIGIWRISALLQRWEIFRTRIEELLAEYRGDVEHSFTKLESALTRLRSDLDDVEAISQELSTQKAVIVTDLASVRREIERELIDKNGILSARLLDWEKRLAAVERSVERFGR